MLDTNVISALMRKRYAARAAALIAASQRQAGRPIEIRDAQIAGIAAARRATVATRNTRHFSDLGIALVDPWAARCLGRRPVT